MVDVFVNYRTMDAAYGAAACFELLSGRFGREQVFRDCVSMLPGQVYPEAIKAALEQARALIVLIGPDWFATDAKGRRLIDRTQDWVRREIRRALARDIVVVPVLLDGVDPPQAHQLPADIEALALRQAFDVGHRSLGADMSALADHLTELIPELVLPSLFEPSPELPDDPLPSMLLRSEYRVVQFHGRDDELYRLTGWLSAPESVSVRLVTGPGGQGKTRLADKLIELAGRRGWVAGFVTDPVPRAVAARLPELRSSLLLVLDYAECRVDQLADLAGPLASRRPEQGKVRLLLLARSTGVWQQFLRRHRDDRVASLFVNLPNEQLPALVPKSLRRQEFRRAVTAFATRMRRRTVRVPPPVDLNSSRYDRALDVHAAALAAVLNDAAERPVPAHADPVLRVLDHERRYWDRTMVRFELPDPHLARIEQAVLAATLFGADDKKAARLLLAALPTFDGAGVDVVDRYLRWLRAIYPGPTELNPLRPDRLGEDLVATILREQPEIATAVTDVIDRGQLARALTVLARAVPRHPDTTMSMRTLLDNDHVNRVPVAMMVATQIDDSDALVDVITEISNQHGNGDPELDDAIAISASTLPERSLALDAFAVVRIRAALARCLREDEPDAETIATLAHNLSVRLTSIGRHDEALTTASAAVRILQVLADDNTEYQADLANALNTLALGYGELGMPEDGLVPAEEAVSLLRQVIAEQPEVRSRLATAIMNYGNLLGDLGQRETAIVALAEAVDLQRTEVALATGDTKSDRLSRLAVGLENLALGLGYAGRHDQALDTLLDAVDTYRVLDTTSSDSIRSYLVNALNNLSGAYSDVGRPEDGWQAADEALSLALELVNRYGAEHRRMLGAAFHNVAVLLRMLGRHEPALTHATEAVGVFREVATANPGTGLSGLADALAHLGYCFGDVGRLDLAREAYEESVEIYRKLAGPGHDAVDGDLAEALLSLADVVHDDGEVELASELAIEACGLLARLIEQGHTGLRHALRDALHLRSLIAYDLGRFDDVIDSATQADDLYRELADHHNQQWAECLQRLANAQEATGHLDDAVTTFFRAIGLLRDLGTEAEDHADQLADLLHDLSVCLSGADRDHEALERIREAVDIRRRLSESQPNQHALALSLHALADALCDVGWHHEAVSPATEAVQLCAHLHGTDEPALATTHVYALIVQARALRPIDAAAAKAALGQADRISQAAEDSDLMNLVQANR